MRLPEVAQRDALPEDKRYIYDYLAETRGAVRPPFSVLLNHPDVCHLVSQVGTFARFKSALSKDVIETATLAAAREFDCRFEWAAHVPQARNAGVSDAVIDAIARRSDVSGLGAKEALVINYVRQVLHDHRADDATWGGVMQTFGKDGALELTMTAGYYGMLASFLNVLQIEPAAEAPQLPGTKPEGV
jgi:4-carboxymuconolactone decarboxylase